MIEAPVPWVLKVGGRELLPGAGLGRVVRAVSVAVRAGRPTVLVHGGGEEISARARALGLPVQSVDGQRVTDSAMLEVVTEVLAGRVNLRLVDALQRGGLPAVGISGVSGRLLTVRPVPALGYVGEPAAVRPRVLRTLLAAGQTPVVAPLGSGPNGVAYNVNADRAAGALAAALSAELSLLTDVPAVLDGRGHPIARLRRSEIERLVGSGAAHGGMVVKLRAAEASLSGGARSVWIGDLDGLAAPGGPKAPGTWVVGRRRATEARTPTPRLGAARP